MLESSIRWVVRKAIGSKKGGDYCWSLNGQYTPFGVNLSALGPARDQDDLGRCAPRRPAPDAAEPKVGGSPVPNPTCRKDVGTRDSVSAPRDTLPRVPTR
ncbi:MAG: hypothetical protein IT462_07440 [Planctomycetes bacterium]|nr:hypothetical protein [Planctomycetota bacterium]